MMAKVFCHVRWRIEKVRQRAAGHQQLLADLDDLDQLGRIAIEGRPCCRASRAATVAGVHGDADIGLGERRGVVGAVAAHGDQLALGLPRRGSALSLSSGVRLGQGRSSTPASAAMAAAVMGFVAGDHHRADAHAPEAR